MADETKIIYTMIDVSKEYDRKQVLKGVNLSYFYGAKIGVLGLNGQGKSTLLRIMSGQEKEFEGKAQLQAGYTVGFLEQEPTFKPEQTVKEAVMEAAQDVYDLLAEFDAINEKFAEEMSPEDMDKLLVRQAKVQDKLDHMGAWEIDSKLQQAMDALRCPPEDAVIGPLSGGEKRRVALCQLLLRQPDVLLLDEPTNHLDADSVGWLERHLDNYTGTVIAVTHDRYFLDNVAGWILEIDRGKCIPWEGNYSSWLEQKNKRMALDAKADEQLKKKLQQELEWIRKTPACRQAKNKARIQRYEELHNEQQENQSSEIDIYIPPGPRLGNLVIKAKGVSKAYGERLLFEDMNFELPAGGIVGVIGPNGAGKTTLFRMITGQEQPDTGEVTVGDTVKLAYVEQSRDGAGRQHGCLGSDLRRQGRNHPRQTEDALARLRRQVLLPQNRPVAKSRHAVGRATQPRTPRTYAQGRLQRIALGRADQRPGREDDPRVGDGTGRLCGLRGGDQPRPLVPGPHGDAHPRV